MPTTTTECTECYSTEPANDRGLCPECERFAEQADERAYERKMVRLMESGE